MYKRVRAEFALTKLRQEENEITVHDAIEVLVSSAM